MRLLLLIVSFLFYTCCFSQAKRQKFLVAEYRIDSPRVGTYTYLVAYNFINGKYISKDTLFEAEVYKKGIIGLHVKYSPGNNFIYKNRYVVAANGSVIDIKERRLVIEQNERFVEAIGDTLIFHRRELAPSTGYFFLDLITKKYESIEDNTWYKPKMGNVSPDGKHYLYIQPSVVSYKIWLYGNNDNGTTLVWHAGRGPFTIATQAPTIETHWLNNQSFLYAVHEPKKDSLNHISFYKVILHRYNIHYRTDNVFFILDSVPQGKPRLNGSFFIDPTGQTIYKATSGSNYIIDTAHQTLTETKYSQLGFNFSRTLGTWKGTGFKYKGQDIGKIWCIKSMASDGVIAATYGDVRTNLGYPKGFKVWTQATRSWITIDVPWISAIIGWVNEE
jgi:hypothetical protein